MRFLRKLCAVMLALLLTAAPALAASMAVVTNQAAEVYRSAASDSESVRVKKGLEMTLTAYKNGWGRVSRNGYTGYVRLKCLDLKSPVAVWAFRDVTVYADAGSRKLGTLTSGTKLYLIGIEGDYARVTDSHSAHRGFVAMSALTTNAPRRSLLATASDCRKSHIERVIYVAQNLMGRPYALNANPPANFHCAAFVWYCYNAASKGCVGATLSEQLHDASHARIDSISALKRGDLVGFNFSGSDDRTGHVGIYIGDGWFVHASASEGKVTVDKLTSGYYKRTFSWGRRILDD